MSKCDKIQDAQIQINNSQHYKPLRNRMTVETSQRVHELVAQLHQNNFIDDKTKKWFSQMRDPPRIPIFYTLTKIHKPNPVGRPIISGCEGPTERLSFFVDKLLQPIAQKQKSYLKDTTDFVNFIEKTKVSQDTILVSMDVTSLYTNIPQEEGITTVCRAYQAFHNNNPPIPSHYLKEMLKLILQENSFQFIGNNYLQTHGTAMGTKMAVAFANIFMADIETKMISQSKTKPIEWKRFIDDIFPLWTVTKRKLTCSLNKLTSILQLNLRLKFQITRQPFSTQLFLKQNVSEMNRSLTSVRIIGLLKPFSIHILPRAIHWVWKEVLLKAKHSDYWEQTLLKQRSMKVSQILNRTLQHADTRTRWYRQRYRKSTSQKDSQLYNKRKKLANKCCLLSQHTTHQCVTLKIYWCKTGT